MIMPKNKRVIEKEDIMPLDIYTSQRKQLRKKINSKRRHHAFRCLYKTKKRIKKKNC